MHVLTAIYMLFGLFGSLRCAFLHFLNPQSELFWRLFGQFNLNNCLEIERIREDRAEARLDDHFRMLSSCFPYHFGHLSETPVKYMINEPFVNVLERFSCAVGAVCGSGGSF